MLRMQYHERISRMYAAPAPCSSARHRSLAGRAYLLLVLAIFASGARAQIHAQATSSPRTRPVNAVQAPLSFEPNLGQDASAARYISYGPGYLLRLEPSRASIAFGAHTPEHAHADALSLTFAGANPRASITAAEPLAATHSYFRSTDRVHWLPNLATYARVNYGGIYPGVDLSFYGNRRQLEYDFTVQPHAEAQPIQIALDQTTEAALDASGNLSLRARGSAFTLLKPVAYQLAGDGRTHQPVAAAYTLTRRDAGARIGFALGQYDPSRALIIDPVLLYGVNIPGAPGYSYAPYYFADTVIDAMTVDPLGNTYVAASVGSSYADCSVMKFSPSGALLYNVSLGSESVSVQVRSIAADSAGDVYLAGSAGPGLPTTPNGLEPADLGTNNNAGFLTVIKADASALTYSSYLGSIGEQGAIYSVAVDAKNNAYVTGYTDSSSFPTTTGAYQNTVTGDYENYGFVSKINPTLIGQASLLYSTYLASPGINGNGSSGNAIAVDASGNAYIASSASAGFPVTTDAYHFDSLSDSGAYVTKLNPTATALVYSAFLGPGSPTAIALDGTNEAYVIGGVSSGEFPTTAGAYQTTYPGGFALKLSADGASLLYSTFLGGPSAAGSFFDSASSIAIAPGCVSACNAYIAGSTASIDFPLVSPIQSFPGSYMKPPALGEIVLQGFLVDLAPAGNSVVFSTYLGAAGSALYNYGAVPAVGLDKAGNIYFASNAEGPDAPVTLPAVQNPGQGFLLKIGPANAGSAVAVPTQIGFNAYAAQVVHTTSAPATVELRNMGSQAITLTRPFVFSSKEFTETDSCGNTLAGGGLCNLAVTFTPAAAGTRSGTLTVATSAPNSPAVVSLSGFAADGPNLVLSSIALTFADQVLNTTGTAQTVTVTNTGDEPEPLLSITDSLADYPLTTNCGAQLATGASCKVTITFKPTQIGLRTDYLYVELPGASGPYYDYVTMNGTGVLSAAGTGTLTLSQSAINFDSIVLGSPAVDQILTVINSGDAPVTLNGIAVTTTKGSASDFLFIPPSVDQQGYRAGGSCGVSYSGGSYYALPFTLAPQATCTIETSFTPSISGQQTGTLSIADSAAGSPHSIGLSGIGLSTVQALTVSPTAMAYPPQPVGDPSAAQTFTLTNGGQDYVIVDRVTTTGDFAIDDLVSNNCEEATLGPQSSCTVSLVFNPSATGARTGTLVLVDTVSGTPQVFNLTGTGIQATGALALGQSSLVFPAQANGTTSANQDLIVSNPGNSPVTINSITATGDFAVTSTATSYSNYCGGVLASGASCEITVAFSPTKASGAETGALTIHSTVGNDAVTLSGTAFTAAQAIHLTPTQVNFGSVLSGTAGGGPAQITAYVENTGSEGVVFSTPPTLTGTGSTPAADFSVANSTCYSYIPFSSSDSPGTLAARQSCSFLITFTPSQTALEQATLSFVDSAGAQTIALSGTGVKTAPAVVLSPVSVAFSPLALGTSSTFFAGYTNITNHGTAPVVINSESVTAGSSDFSINPGDSCAGQTLQPNGSCSSYLTFVPAAAGYRTGTLSFVTSTGTTYTAPLAGYAFAEIDTASLSPQGLVLPSTAVHSSVYSVYQQLNSLTLTNTGNAPMVVGTVSGTNVSSTGDFTIASPQGSDGCSGVTVQPGYGCTVAVGFTPRATGVRTGSLTFPVTYADKTTASFKATVSGTGLTASGSGNLLPQTASYPSQVAGFDTYTYQNDEEFTLTNSGTVTMTVGALTGVNLGSTPQTGSDFVITSDRCSGQQLAPGGSCNLLIGFNPITVGQKTGTIDLPVTYAGGATANFTSTLSGTSVAPAPALQVNPSQLNFNVEVVGTTDTSNVQTAVLTDTGNVPVTIKSITATPNFTLSTNECGAAINPTEPCSLTVSFTPLAATAPGPITGTLIIVDNAPGSPHVIKLAGTAISTAQQLALSQTSVSFPAQQAGTTGAPQVVYLTDLGSSGTGQGSAPRVQINSIKLGGADAADFTESENCGGSLGFTIAGRQGCMITVAFAPGSSATGTLTAGVTITPAQGSPLVIQLVGVVATEARRKAHQPVKPLGETKGGPGPGAE